MANPTTSVDRDAFFRTEHLQVDLKVRSARGGAITLVSQGLKFLIMMAGTMVLSRLLRPIDYGLIGMVVVVTGFISMFKDLGLASATIQREHITHEQISTLFWINVGLSAVVMLVTAAIAPLIAWFYGDSRLTTITIVFSLGFLIGGLSVQHEALLRRQMRFLRLAVIDVVSLLAAPLVGIFLALRGAGFWALVFGQLATSLTTTIGVWIACRWRPGFAMRDSGVRSMLRFGGNITGFAVINYFARNLDNMLIGKVWGPQQLGLYARAYQLLLLPIEQVNAPITAVAVPTLSRLGDSPERYREAYMRMLEAVAILTMPGVAFMIVTSDWIVALVLGPQWRDTAMIFSILGVSGLFQPIANTTGWLFISQNRTHQMFRWGLIYCSAIIVGIIAGLAWGAKGVATSYTLTMLCMMPLLFWYVGRSGPVRGGDFYRAMTPATIASLSILVALYLLRRWAPAVSSLEGILLSMVVSSVVTVLVLLVLAPGRKALQNMRELIPILFRRTDS